MFDDYNPACIMSWMHRPSFHFFLLSSFFLLLSCNPTTPLVPLETTLYAYRFDPPSLVEFSEDFQPVREIAFSIPPHCGLFNIFSPPIGKFLAIELSCPNGQTVLFLATDSGSVSQPVPNTDSHLLAWAPDGKAAYLKIDSLGSPRVMRIANDGAGDVIQIPEFAYDLAAAINPGEFMFTFSRGMGQGSELHLAQRDGRSSRLLYADLYNYISFVRFSPDGTQIAFIKIPDTQTPFTVGELWVMNKDGSAARKLAEADAGHGYAANWSPSGERIAFVMRENPEDERADQSSAALIGNIYAVDVQTGALTQITYLEDGYAETPLWSPDGNTLAFNVVINDRMEVRIADVGRVGSNDNEDLYRDSTGGIRPLMIESTCCPAWLRK